MFSIVIQGGLGNQLFQLFAALSYSIKYKRDLILPYKKWDYKTRPHYWDSFFKSVKTLTTQQQIMLPRYQEPNFHFNEIPFIDQNFQLHGYFQSYKYFEDNYNEICQLLNISNKQSSIKEKYYTHGDDCISLHFRMGDYKDIQHNYPLMSNEYYIKSIQMIIDKTKKDIWNILYFCEKEDNIEVEERINNYKTKFPNFNFNKAPDNLEDWEQMLLMSCCTHNVMANSSFSWWGAYFNQNKEKIVCYPSVWFGPALKDKHLIKNLCPEEWVKI